MEDLGNRTLDKLFMETGSLLQLSPTVKEDTWISIAANLKQVYLPLHKAGRLLFDYASLCTIYYTAKTKAVAAVKEDEIVKAFAVPDLKKAGLAGQVAAVVDFLEEFMTANGQWAYIKKQDWFANGEWVIAIDVNYYPDRSEEQKFPQFHKDTGGNNIFVNLIFDNDTQIEATEWFTDVWQPSRARQAWQQGLLPPSHLQALRNSRIALLHHAGDKVAGGLTVGRYSFVSWVDDLVWHATPSLARRAQYSAEAAQRAYPSLDQTLAGDFAYHDSQLGFTVLGLEVLATIAESSKTELYKWLQEQGYTAQDINSVQVGPKQYEFAVAAAAWKARYSGPGGEDRFVQDAKIRAGSSPWLITGVYSDAIAYDPRLEDSKAISETPPMSGRSRANSDPETQAVLEKVRKANEGKSRSFIRTWVRIVSANSDEVKKVDSKLWK